MLNKKKGMTLIETIMATLFVVGAVATTTSFTIDYVKDENNLSNANLPLGLVKAVDQRIKIDGYNYNLWSSLPNRTNTDAELSSFIEKAFTSRMNSECGVADGWLPNMEEAEDISLLPCFFKDFSSNRYDEFVSISQNNIEMLSSFDIILRLKAKHDLNNQENFLMHKKLLNEIKSNAPEMETGIFRTGFYNFLDLAKEVDINECLALGNNCAIKTSWLSEGYSQGIRVDGLNNMISDTISFAADYRSDPYECLLWEYDELGAYNLTGNVDCGVGLYPNSLRPSLVTVDAAVNSVNFGANNLTTLPLDDAILLDKECKNYIKRADGFLDENGVSRCGLYVDAGGFSKVVQVVDELQIDPNYINSNVSLKIEELISKELSSADMNVLEDLLVKDNGSMATLNVLEVSDYDAILTEVVVLNGINTLERLEVNTETEFKSNLTTIGDDSDPANIIKALVVTQDVDLSSIMDTHTVGGDLITNNLDVGQLRLREMNIVDGLICLPEQKGTFHFTGETLLTCRETDTAGTYRWFSDVLGRVSAFTSVDSNGNGTIESSEQAMCPEGWTEVSDTNGRALVGSGKVFDGIAGELTYSVDDKGGQQFVKLTVNEMPAHTHDYKDAWYSERWGPKGKGNTQGSGDTDNDNNVYERSMTSENTGGNNAHENRMPYAVVKYCRYKSSDGQTTPFTDPNLDPDDYWYPYPDELGDWYRDGAGKNCSGFIYHDLTSSGQGEFWTRDCDQDYKRNVIEREINYITGVVRTIGLKDPHEKTERVTEVWVRYIPRYTPWVDFGNPYNCSHPAVTQYDRGSYWDLVLSCKIMRERDRYEQIMLPDSDNLPMVPPVDIAGPFRETGEFTANATFNIPDSDTYKTCGSWEITATENAKVWTPDASNFDRVTDVNQTRTVEQYRDCDIKTNFMGHTYILGHDKEYRDQKQTRTIKGSKINLHTWVTYDTNGKWSVATDGSYVFQSINGNPTIYETVAKDYGKDEGSVFRGKIKVGYDGDDDYVGFVMGKQDQNNFYLWSWKKGNQGAGKAGHTFAKVTGGVGVIGWDTHVTKPGYTALASDLGTGKGWTWDQYYEFRIEYKRDNIRVFIDGKLIFDIDGSYPQGGVGFYNNSQSKVSKE